MKDAPADFAARLLAWFDRHGRNDLPWQHPRTPYRVWVAEVMLQQTRVTAVIPYFERFLQRFPDVRALAAAPLDDVLALWAGLGYYARGRNLHAAARRIVTEHDAELPARLAPLGALPGIGRTTAGAILAQAHGQRHAILDGNARRLLARHAAVEGWPGEPAVQRRLWDEAERRLPQQRLADYTQAVMDVGSTVCRSRRPLCADCPVQHDCAGRAEWQRYPAAKPRRERPRRQSHLLLLHSADGRLFLERRPPRGIWGGLWCPPVLDVLQDWRAALRERFGFECGPEHRLAALHHGFTHFDLELRPLRAALQAPSRPAQPAGTAWIRLGGSEALPGLPAPVQKLLSGLAPCNDY